MILPQQATYYISSPGGGDCGSIGTWDPGDPEADPPTPPACTLNTNVDESIEILSDGITLDGNGHEINHDGYGVYMCGRTGVTIKSTNPQPTLGQNLPVILLYILFIGRGTR